MSLLTPPITPTLTQAQLTQQRKNAIALKANALLNAPLQNFNGLLSQWQKGMSFVWDDENPQDIITALGTHAVELFDLSAKTATFLETLQAGCTTETTAKVKLVTPHPDGSITIN